MSFECFEKESYSSFCKALIKEKGSQCQKDFLKSMLDRNSFVKFITDRVEKAHDAISTPEPLNARLTEEEFKNMPLDTEKMIYDSWKAIIVPGDAVSSSFWAMVTLRNIEAYVIEPYFLASDGRPNSGKSRIEVLLKKGEDKQIDGAVRDSIRRFSGLMARGNRTVYVDCVFSRAWWRVHFATDVCRNTSAKYEKVHDVLRISNSFWEVLIDFMVSRNSTMGYANVRSALLYVLSNSDPKLLVGKEYRNKFRRLSMLSAVQEFGIFDIEELKVILTENLQD